MCRQIWWAVASLLMLGCQAAPQYPGVSTAPPAPRPTPSSPYALSPSEVAATQAGVRSFLKDPYSAMFSGRILAARHTDGTITACGLVNAKNSYGGYTGDGPYIATIRDGAVVDAATGTGRDAQFVVQLCRERGVQI